MSIAENKIPWTIKDVIWVFVSMFGLIFLAQYLLSPYLDESNQGNSLLVLALLIIQWGTMLIPLYIFGIRKHKNAIKHFQLSEKISLKKLLKYIGLAYLVYIAIAILLGILIENGIEIPGLAKQEPHIPLFGDTVFDLAIAFIVISIIAPIIEEVFFRGFVLQTLAVRLGRWWGTILTAVLFASIHFEFQSITGLLILSLLINELYLRSKSIIVVIAFHMLNNTLAFTAEYLVENGIISL